MDFIVINETVINSVRLLAIEHRSDTRKLKPFYNSDSEIPESSKLYYVQVEERWEIDERLVHSTEKYIVMFDSGKELSLKPQDGKLLVEWFRSQVKPSDGKIATTSADAT
ncbi:MAG: hypothetical protein JWM21_949 [Acidobacteria bacterium]|nr:hypothetical protein [Acidobacteriota bacterium]